MKNIILVTILVHFSINVNAQTSESIIVGIKETIYSKVLNENRKLWIYNPSITSQNTSPDKRYPVMYLLDGDAHFLSTVGIVQQLSQANGNGVLPEMIVVAIENTNRVKDLTPVLLTEMKVEFWQDCNYEEELLNWRQIIDVTDNYCALAKLDERYVGFIHMMIRNDYVEGSNTDKTPYLEAIYIKPAYRHKNIATLLVNKCEHWAKSKRIQSSSI